ncbi:IS1096 element passenger TnpR family protein [Arvimicrobium flavum]|uniref:IS1096 element passenger TnpR family protein n=1 Tax=Arvimicrobium flavum TaxID=3393320 RepID=UPI00237AB822|nr:plasmid pRiA4b ORF-3 family protein [Mesorhizobium shangrilense]
MHTVCYGSWELTAESPDIGLNALKLRKGSRFLYEYDLNVPWGHEVRLEERRAAKPRTLYPCCIGGDGNCPPEGSGGAESWMHRKDEAFGLETDEDVMTALALIQEISDTRSLAIFDDPDRAEELQELLFRIESREDLLGKPFKRRQANKRLRRNEHLTHMHQQM